MQGSSITENFQLISFVMLFGGKADTTKLQSYIVGKLRIDTCLVVGCTRRVIVILREVPNGSLIQPAK
jgi:hypothetical protein